jgi:ABC-2 type transport system permease protein
MSTPPNDVTALGDASAPTVAPAALSATRPLYWSVRRELWENRYIYIVPLAVAGLFLFGFLISMIGQPDKMRALSALASADQREAVAKLYDLAAVFIMATGFVVGIFYSLEALHGERRDRSILFWKSLPVSDLTTVLSKATIPIVILPLFTFSLTVITQLIMLLLSSLALQGTGLSVAMLWTHVSLLHRSLMLLYHLVTIHMLWYAPFYGWLLMVSAWARRAAFLWAALPLAAIAVVEKIAFNTSHFVDLLQSRLSGGAEGDVFTAGTTSINQMAHLTPGTFLIDPGLWAGLAVAAGFLAVAVRVRRSATPI